MGTISNMTSESEPFLSEESSIVSLQDPPALPPRLKNYTFDYQSTEPWNYSGKRHHVAST